MPYKFNYITGEKLSHLDWNFAAIQLNKINDVKHFNSGLNGGNGLVLGTSIPAGGGYHEIAFAQNGATCINRAQGSSMVRTSKIDGTITGIPWTCYGYALCHTIAEKQNLIDNWSTIRLSLSASPPTTLDQSTKDLFLSCSYENRLLPYLNGNQPKPSVIVFDHGFNDYSPFSAYSMDTPNGTVFMQETEEQFITMPTGSARNDKHTFLSGMNFLLDLIFQWDPRQKVFLISHYEGLEAPRIIKAQQILADAYELPILRLDQKLGWSNQIAIGSQSLYATGDHAIYAQYFDNTNEDMTIKNVWLPDRLHLHSDTTGKARDRVASKVGYFYFQES